MEYRTEAWIIGYLSKLTEEISRLNSEIESLREIAAVQIPKGRTEEWSEKVVDKSCYIPDNPLFSASIVNDGDGDIYVRINDGRRILVKSTDAPLEFDMKAPKIKKIEIELKDGTPSSVRIRGVY